MSQPPLNLIPPNQVPLNQNQPINFEEYGREKYKGNGAYDDAYIREEEIIEGLMDQRGYQKHQGRVSQWNQQMNRH